MQRGWFLGAGFLTAVAIFSACGSSSDGGSSGGVCTPGATQSCVGPGGCSGGQACKDDGSGYAACNCGGSDGGSNVDAGGGDASLDSGSFDPQSLAGLVLWVSADDLVTDGGGVSLWPDRSGRGHDLVAGTTAPVVQHAAIGGRDAVKFSPDSTLVHAARETDFGWGTDKFVVEMVVSFATVSQGVVFALQDGATHELNFQINTDPAFQYYWGGDQQSAPIATGSHLVAFRRTGTSTGEFHVDGVVTAVPVGDVAETTLTPSASIFVGGQDPLYYDGDIAEIVVVHDPADADVTSLEAYLKSKYGL